MKRYFIIAIVTISLLFSSCEDPVPLDDYIPRKIIEAYVYVDQPIRDITVAKSQPLNQVFSKTKSFKDGIALVDSFNIQELDNAGNVVKEIKLIADSIAWSAEDTNYLVKPKTRYKMNIKFTDGDYAYSETTTPDRIFWDPKFKIKQNLQYPIDTLKLPPTDTIGWTPVTGTSFYMVSVVCLDTLKYGYYQSPQDNLEQNRRIARSFRSDNFFRDANSSALIANTKTPVVWGVFKWFGKHEIALYAPDYNLIRWFLANRASREYNPLLGSLKANNENTIGVFSGSSMVRDTFFLVKNQK